MDIRRVVTGHDSAGKSVFVSDDTVRPVRPTLMPGAEFHQLWGGDKAPEFPDGGSMPQWHSYFPPVGGFRFAMLTLPPSLGAEAQPLDIEKGLAEMEDTLPGMLGYMDASDPGMHTTDTIDFEVVLEGTVVLELDDGAEVTLRPGDTAVQNGTRHRWKNPGDAPTRMAVFICGASHANVTR